MLIIDRFEENMAVLEYEDVIFTIPRSLLPKDVREGDVITLNITIDRAATKDRKSRIKSLEDILFRH